MAITWSSAKSCTVAGNTANWHTGIEVTVSGTTATIRVYVRRSNGAGRITACSDPGMDGRVYLNGSLQKTINASSFPYPSSASGDSYKLIGSTTMTFTSGTISARANSCFIGLLNTATSPAEPAAVAPARPTTTIISTSTTSAVAGIRTTSWGTPSRGYFNVELWNGDSTRPTDRIRTIRVPASGTITSTSQQTFTIDGLSPGRYYYLDNKVAKNGKDSPIDTSNTKIQTKSDFFKVLNNGGQWVSSPAHLIINSGTISLSGKLHKL